MKFTILIAEDNDPLRNLLKDVLEGWGYNIWTATDGRSCLEIAGTEQPDLILLDIMLPGLSGYEVCAALKQSDETRAIPVVIMTVLLDEESRIHGYGVGADNFLVKPVKYDELKAIIQNLLDKKLYRDTLEEDSGVIRMLQGFGRLLAVQSSETDAFRMGYCNKLLESLRWDKNIAEKARIALLFPSPDELAGKIGATADKIIALTDNLRMGRWLKPVLQFLNAPLDCNKQFYPLLEECNCLKVAELVLVINRYTDLFNQKSDSKKAIDILKQEANACGYNQTIVKQLEEILNAETILENIQNGLK